MKLAALSVIVACCVALVYGECGSSEVATVQQQWQATFGTDQAAFRQFAVAAFERTVSQYPELRPSSSAAAEAGARRIMHRLSTGISLLNQPAALQQTLQSITSEQTPANQHPVIYRAHLQSILALLPQYVGDSYDADAFHCCLTMLVDNVVNALTGSK